MARDKIHIDLVLNTKGFRPLGRINGQLGEFEKSLDASNARVLAFGASAGAILAVKKAFTATVKAAIEVEKSLKDINVILGATSANLKKFGSDLFEIASLKAFFKILITLLGDLTVMENFVTPFINFTISTSCGPFCLILLFFIKS